MKLRTKQLAALAKRLGVSYLALLLAIAKMKGGGFN